MEKRILNVVCICTVWVVTNKEMGIKVVIVRLKIVG
jgi:hypothetical protein